MGLGLKYSIPQTPMFSSFTDLEVWTSGTDLLKEAYQIANRLPTYERYGLASQLRRASVSILTNVAEGFSRSTNNDKAHRYTIARGECTEVRAILLIIVTIGHLDQKDVDHSLDLSNQTGKLLTGLIHRFTKTS